MMRHEKLIKRGNGDKINIVVDFTATSYREEFNYQVEVWAALGSKRKFTNVVNADDYEYRRQSFPDGRNAWANRKHLEFVTKEEILQAKTELWEKLKPTE